MKVVLLTVLLVFIVSVSSLLIYAFNNEKVTFYNEEFVSNDKVIIPKGYYLDFRVMDFINIQNQDQHFELPKDILSAHPIILDRLKNSDHRKTHEDIIISLTRNCAHYRKATLDVFGNSKNYCIVELSNEKFWINLDLIHILKFRNNRDYSDQLN